MAAAAFAATVAQAQPAELSKVEEITFFGVDFSKGRIYAADNTPAEMREAYSRINNLFMSEPDKYDVEKYTGKPLADIKLSPVADLNAAIPDDAVSTFRKEYKITAADTDSTAAALASPDAKGVGFVIVMQQLNKAKERATYHMVFFDMQSGAVLLRMEEEGDAGGFGLRNYWAASVLDAMKHMKRHLR